MALTLSVTDNADGTGTATIGGADPLAAITLYRVAFTGQAGSLVETSAGTRTGDGTVGPVSGAGWYVWYATSASPTDRSPPVYQPITDTSAESVLYRILTSVSARVVALNLPGLPSTKIRTQWVPRTFKGVDPDLPSVLIAPFGGETFPARLISTDDVVYPIVVVLMDNLNNNVWANGNRDSLWREQVGRAFRSQRLAGVSEVWYCEQVPQTIVDPALFAANIWFSAVQLNFIARETRNT